MAQQGKFIPPTYGPDVLARQLQMMQDTERARHQIEQGMQPLQGQMVSNHYIAPHWSQQLAQGLNRYQGERTMQQLPEQMAELQNMQQQQMMGQFGFGQPSPQQLAQGLSGEQPQASMPQQGAPQGQGPMLLPGLTPEQSQMALMTLGPEKYMQVYQEQFKPTNEQRNLAHLPADQRNQLLEAGFLNEATKDGMQTIRGADGRLYSVPVPGYAESQAALQGGITSAQEGARAAHDLVEVPTGDGGTQFMSREDALRALQGGGAPSGQNQGGNSADGFGTTQPGLDTVKERRDFEKSVRADVATGERTLRLVDRNIAYIDRLLANEDGLRGIVGRAAQFKPTLLMLDGELEANADIDTIKSKVVLQTMEEMRKSSAAGATGFGNMNREQLKVIQDALGSLERAQTGDQIIQNLRVIRNTFEQMRNDAIQDYDAEVQQYGQYLSRDFQPGEFGTTRPTQSPSDITGGNAREQQLSNILGF